MGLTVSDRLHMIEAEPRLDVRAERLRDLTTIHPDDARVWLRLSGAELQLRSFGPAFAALERALCLDLSLCDELPADAPVFWRERVAILQTLPRAIRPEERLEVANQLERLILRYRDFTPLHFNLAVLLAELGRPAEARARAEVALGLSPTLLPLFPAAIQALLRPPAAPPPPPDPLARDRVGRYRVLRIAERTPQHVLYDAVDDDDGVPVTLRRLLAMPAASARRLFADQARRPLEADELIAVLGLVDADDGTPYQILERVRGRSVLDAFAEPPDDLDLGINLVWLIARAVDNLAERARYVHGQLGPATVIFVDDNLTRPFRLIDVGLHARLQVGGSSLPLHDAPETAPSPAADVFGLGRLLHYVLTGRLPALGPVDLGRLPAPLRDDMTAIVDRCLAPDPARRYRSPGGLADALESVFASVPEPVATGAVLDDWILGRKLSDEGEFAVVYAATHREDAGLEAAVKVLRPHYACHREARHRFESEILNTPEHPGIVRIWPRHRGRRGLPYYAMELLVGASLRQALDAGAPAATLAIAWAIELAEAMTYAHAEGVVHRDLKPENVFVMADGGPRRVKVLDFGIAKVRDAALKTRLHQRIGTLGYMAPEQARGDDTTAAVDVYALGVIVVEALVGAHPLDRRCNQPYQPVVRTDALARLHPVLGAERVQLEQVLRAMTAEDPTQRPPMAEALRLLTDVSRHLGARTALARPGPAAGTLIAPAGPTDRTLRPPGVADRLATVVRTDPANGSTSTAAPTTPPPRAAPAPPRTRQTRPSAPTAAVVIGGLALLASSGWYYASATTPPACPTAVDGAATTSADFADHVDRLLRAGCRDAALRLVRARRAALAPIGPAPAQADVRGWLDALEEAIRR